MPDIYEIAPDVFRISLYVPDINLQFNHFLVRDQEPLLFHTGTRAMFKTLYEQVARVVDQRASAGSDSVISNPTNVAR